MACPPFFRHQHKSKGKYPDHSATDRTIIQVGLGLLLALPFLFQLSSLLASADAVFASYVNDIHRWLNNLSIGRLPGQLLISLAILPFGLSWMISGLAGQSIIPVMHTGNKEDTGIANIKNTGKQQLLFGKTFVITVLVSIYILYLLFALVQFTYLSSAWRAQLPDGMTYAEYARSGFFELLAVSMINCLSCC